MQEKQHASIEIATLSKENGFRVSAKKQHWFFGKPGRWPPKIINFPAHFQTILLDPMAPPGSLISTGKSRDISRKSLVYFLDTNGLQAPKARTRCGVFFVWKLMNPYESQLWECFGQPSPSTKALFFSNRIPNYPSHNKSIIFHWWNNQDTKTSWKKSGYKNQWECGSLQECMQLNIPC